MKEEILEGVEVSKEKEEKKHEFETQKISKLLMKFAIPCVISLLVNSLYNIVDQIFIGQGVGYLGNTATNIVFPLVVIATAFALMFGDGGASYLSLKLGEKKKEEASKGVGNAIFSIVCAGILFFVIGTLFRIPLLKLFGMTDGVRDYAIGYMKYIVLGLPFMMFTTALNSMIRADGSPKYAMITILSGAVLNTILDPIFIFKFHMGVEGAAIATVISQLVSFVITLTYFKKFKSVDVNKETLMPNLHIIRKVASLGISSFITQIAITIVIITENNSLKYYGASSKYGSDIAIAALGIVMKVNQILISIVVGIGAGAQPIEGYNYGARNFDRVRKTYLMSAGVAVFLSLIALSIFEIFPQAIVNLFGQAEGLYNEFALKCFRVFLMLCACNGFQIVSSIFFQAIGKPVKSALLSLSRQILLFVPAALILPRFFGIDGILYAGPVADGIAFLIAFGFIIIEMKNLKLKHEKEYE